MALMLLRVFLVGVFAAAADDVPITWWSNNHAVLPCVVPQGERVQLRRPPPPLEGDDTPRVKAYSWRRGEENISPKRVSSSGALEVSRRGRKEGEGVYQCSLRHHGGVVLGYPTHLKFATIQNQFSVHPENATARSGQPFLLSCNISSAPPATVSWLKDDLPLPEDERYHVLQNQLIITDVMTTDEGSYRCIATNPYLNKSRTSHAGRLTVQIGAGDQDAAFLPVSYEADVYAPRGSRIVLPCPVTGWPRPRLIWELIPPDQRVAELDVVDQVFVIRSLEEDQQGIYTCTIEDNNKLIKTFSVTMTEAANITVRPSSREMPRASTVRFNCTAAGRPEPHITWYKDGQLLSMPANGRINLRKSTDGKDRIELVISGVTSDDAGVYQCFARNQAGLQSHWATLNVTGEDAPRPTNVRCWPLGDRTIKVAWDKPAGDREVVAYTLHGTSEEEERGSNSLPGQPLIEPVQTVTVDTPLVPYRFQVRAYITTASDLSAPTTCQGQGVPIRMATVGKDQVIVSWKQFAKENPGVVQWILQTRPSSSDEEHNITLDGAVTNHTITAPPHLQVRLLGSRTLKWLQQDLSLVRWSSTATAGTDLYAGDEPPIPDKLSVMNLTAKEFTVSWQCGGDLDSKYSYLVCVRSPQMESVCVERNEPSATFKELLPGTAYNVSVQARAVDNRALRGPFSQPYTIKTPLDSPERFRELSAHYVNSSMILVSWNGAPAHYRVHYSAELKLPVEHWDSVDTKGSSVLVPVIDPANSTFLMVTGYDPLEHSKITTVRPYITKPNEPSKLNYEIKESGIRVWWTGDEPRLVSYSQNITTPLEQWITENTTGNSIELPVNVSASTFVLVTQTTTHRSQMLTIDPQPPKAPEPSTDHLRDLKLGLILGLFLVLILMGLAAVCLWRKRKRALSPHRSRRRNAESNEENAEEQAEMKAVGGASARRLANGGARGAGEPLLNGHVHITENPTSKTPNGKVKKERRRNYEAAFDLSRYEDPDATQETVLEADTSASYNLLDTSRGPEFDLSRSSHEMSANNSFAKLPDDNMNSELTRSSFQLDNSKIQPTLQPNG